MRSPDVLKSSIFAVAVAVVVFLASPSAAQGGNWDILYQSTDADVDTRKVTLDYRIGAGRRYDVDLFERDCVVPVPGVPFDVSPYAYTADHGGLEISLDLDESAIASRNIWEGDRLQFCVRVRLLSVGSLDGEEQVIKEE